jgi:hypothetical protein
MFFIVFAVPLSLPRTRTTSAHSQRPHIKQALGRGALIWVGGAGYFLSVAFDRNHCQYAGGCCPPACLPARPPLTRWTSCPSSRRCARCGRGRRWGRGWATSAWRRSSTITARGRCASRRSPRCRRCLFIGPPAKNHLARRTGAVANHCGRLWWRLAASQPRAISRVKSIIYTITTPTRVSFRSALAPLPTRHRKL